MLRRGGRATGIGDDAAVLDAAARASRSSRARTPRSRTCTSERGWLTPREIGYRAAAAALSDLAAMAAAPAGLLVALACRRQWRNELDASSPKASARSPTPRMRPIIGGNISRAASSVAHDHRARHGPRPLGGHGARRGDTLYVTGRSAARAPRSTPAARRDAVATSIGRGSRAAAAHRRSALARGARARAAIDISDGLVADARHLAAASGVRVRARLGPRAVCRRSRTRERRIASGEEYELLVASPRRVSTRTRSQPRFGDSAHARSDACIERRRRCESRSARRAR